jgi:hypothetical protein
VSGWAPSETQARRGPFTAVAVAERIVAARKPTWGPLRVNLFGPHASAGTPVEFNAFAAALAGEAEHDRIRLGNQRHNDDGWTAKLDVVHDQGPELVSFTCGLPTMRQGSRLQNAGIITGVATRTTVQDAGMAIASCSAARVVKVATTSRPAVTPRATLLPASPEWSSMMLRVSSSVASARCPWVMSACQH